MRALGVTAGPAVVGSRAACDTGQDRWRGRRAAGRTFRGGGLRRPVDGPAYFAAPRAVPARVHYVRKRTHSPRARSVRPPGPLECGLEHPAQHAAVPGQRLTGIDPPACHQQAFAGWQEVADRERAARCAFRLAMATATHGEPAMFAGWTSRAEHLVAESDGAARGWVAFLRMCRGLGSGAYDDAAAAAAAPRPPPPAAATTMPTWPWPSWGSAPMGASRSMPAGSPTGWRCSTRPWSASSPTRRRRSSPARLLHGDRGLPGDQRLRPGGGVDLAPRALVRCPAGAAHLHRPVRGAPVPAHADPRRVVGGAGGVRARHRAFPAGRRARRDRAGRLRGRRRTALRPVARTPLRCPSRPPARRASRRRGARSPRGRWPARARPGSPSPA